MTMVKVRGIMFHDVGLCIIIHPHPPSGTHQSLRFRKTHQYMKTFNLTSIMTEGQKYYFKQIRFLSRSVTTPRLPCLGRFPFLCFPLHFSASLNASLRSIRRMLTTRLTHEVYLRCTLPICVLLLHIPRTQKLPASRCTCLQDFFLIFFSVF